MVPVADIVRWRRIGRQDIVDSLVEGHFSEMAFPQGPSGACKYFGTPSEPNGCQIYSDRGTTCREFEVGGWQCLEMRRERGVKE